MSEQKKNETDVTIPVPVRERAELLVSSNRVYLQIEGLEEEAEEQRRRIEELKKQAEKEEQDSQSG